MWLNKNNSNLLNLSAFYRLCIIQQQHQVQKIEHHTFLWWKIPIRYKEWETLPVYDVVGILPDHSQHVLFTGTLDQCRKVADQLVTRLKPFILEGEKDGS